MKIEKREINRLIKWKDVNKEEHILPSDAVVYFEDNYSSLVVRINDLGAMILEYGGKYETDD